VPDIGEPVRIGPGDIAITRAPDHYNVSDSPTTPPIAVVHPNQRCCDLDGNSVLEEMTRSMHDDPAYPWTLDKLATESGASRASLARRFHDLVGEPPMTFLKNWRMALAADLLCQPDETVGTVADKVGYSTPFSFSAACKRVRGLSPQEHRAIARLAV
jgi:AraC-like DNA-binding protein